MVIRSVSGFTLTEILMVILLISILGAIAIPQFVDFGNDAKTAVTQNKLRSLKIAIVGDASLVSSGTFTKPGYEFHCLGPPATLSNLTSKPAAGTCMADYDPFTKRGWRGPYVSTTDPSWNLDGWGSVIQYFNAGPPARTLRSCGPDRICGNGDDLSVQF